MHHNELKSHSISSNRIYKLATERRFVAINCVSISMTVTPCKYSWHMYIRMFVLKRWNRDEVREQECSRSHTPAPICVVAEECREASKKKVWKKNNDQSELFYSTRSHCVCTHTRPDTSISPHSYYDFHYHSTHIYIFIHYEHFPVPTIVYTVLIFVDRDRSYLSAVLAFLQNASVWSDIWSSCIMFLFKWIFFSALAVFVQFYAYDHI